MWPPPLRSMTGTKARGDEQRAVEVGLELAADVLDGRVQEVRVHGDARVVDQDRDVLRLLGRRRDGRGVADLQRQRDRVRGW
jgi:hypothetical protein